MQIMKKKRLPLKQLQLRLRLKPRPDDVLPKNKSLALIRKLKLEIAR